MHGLCYHAHVKIDFHDALQSLLSEHREYSSEAYRFLYQATNPASYAAHDMPDSNRGRHLSAAEFYAAICRLALQEYGPLARTVFDFWGLHTTQDIAKATYYLIAAGIFSKQSHETIEDFAPLPSLEEMLEKPFIPQSSHP